MYVSGQLSNLHRKTAEAIALQFHRAPRTLHALIVARNVLTGEVKYFLSNRLPREWNLVMGQWITLRWLLRVAFGRCSIETTQPHYDSSEIVYRLAV